MAKIKIKHELLLVTENKAKIREKIRKAIKEKDIFITVVAKRQSACFESSEEKREEIDVNINHIQTIEK